MEAILRRRSRIDLDENFSRVGCFTVWVWQASTFRSGEERMRKKVQKRPNISDDCLES